MTRHVLLTALMAVSVTPVLAAEGAAPATAAKPVVATPAPATKPAADAPAAKLATEADKPLATVNGVAVPRLYGNILRAQAQRAGRPAVAEDEIREEAVKLVLIGQEAIKQGLDKNPALQAQLELQRLSTLARALVGEYANSHPPSEEAIKAEYDRIKAATPARVEYQSHHILVPTEKEAKDLIAKIHDKKAKFEDLAKKHSKDPGSGAKGGELNWSAADAYVPEFGSALTKLAKGEMTKEPVKTKFGFHIIRLDDTRSAEFPAYDKVKGEVVGELKQKAVDEYIVKLRAAAKVE